MSVIAGLLLFGCSSITGFPDRPASSDAVKPNPGYLLGSAGILAYNSELDPERKKAIRNEIIDARMAEYDRKFGDFQRALYREGIGAGVGTDWAVLALTAASSLSTVEATKTAFSTVSTAVVGATASFDKRALFDKTLPALLAQMAAQRETVRTMIRTNEQLPVESYSWYAAESDLQVFEFAGTIPGAIASVAQDAGEKVAIAKKEQRELTRVVFAKTTTSSRLLEFWKPSGKLNRGNADRLAEWMKTNRLGTGAGTITMFIFDSASEDLRTKAIRDLKIN
jgi:hypothetical protein